jgi:hypothetical protein
MKKMYTKLSLFIALTAILTSSCSSDPCKDKTAANNCNSHGTPSASGNSCGCSCDAGYWGTSCTQTYSGQYKAQTDLYSSVLQSSYNPSISIITSGSVSLVQITSCFPYLGGAQSFNGSLSGSNITIADVLLSNGSKLKGTGIISNNGTIAQISWNLTETSSTGVVKTVTGTWTK